MIHLPCKDCMSWIGRPRPAVVGVAGVARRWRFLQLGCVMWLTSRAVLGESIEYPSAARGSTVDEYHGIRVSDPYRWLEDLESSQTRQWLRAEKALTTTYLSRLRGSATIGAKIREDWNYERWSAPEHHGRYWFYVHNDGLQNQSVIYATTDLKQTGRAVLDGNELSPDGVLAVVETAVSPDGC
jgi:prolyl oligopeptidase